MASEPEGEPKRVALVTGAGSGIGQATAIRLAEGGWKLVLTGRRQDPLKDTLDHLAGDGHLIQTFDATCPEEVSSLFSSLRLLGIQLSGLVHCAGVHWLRPVQITTGPLFQEMLDSHLTSTFLLLKEALLQKGFSRGGASIVLVSSAAALQGGAGSFAYAAAKGGLISAMRVAAMEFANRKIRVNALLPGVVETPQSKAFLDKLPPEQVNAIRREHPLGFGKPQDVAAAAEFLLSPGARWITGTTLVVDGGLTAH